MESRPPLIPDSAVLVADDADRFDYRAATDLVEELLPRRISVTSVDLDTMSLRDARSILLSQLNSSPALVHYLGHGGVDVWAAEGLLTTTDVEVLSHGPRYPLVISTSCFTGYFQHLTKKSLSEVFLQTNGGGAVAVWSSSGVTSPVTQSALSRALVAELFRDHPQPTLGDAIIAAKKTVFDSDVTRTWILFGDPTMALPW